VDERLVTAVIPIPGALLLPDLFMFRGRRYVRKSELHVTIVGSRAKLDAAAQREAAKRVDFVVSPTGFFRVARNEDRRSLIEMVEVAGLEAYFVRLERSLRLCRGEIPRPPTHVTYFTEKAGGRGIKLSTVLELERLSKAITDLDEIKALRKATAPAWRGAVGGTILGA
jgi:hypothetical protein